MMQKSKQARIYAFIDSQNLNISVQRLGWKMDWVKFRKFLTEKYGVTEAFMFIGYVPEFEEMYHKLNESGYRIVLKPTYDMTKLRPEAEEVSTTEKGEADEKKPTKGNIDADLVLWAMKELQSYDKAILVSGDGDFYVLVEYLVSQGKLLKLLAPSRYYSGLFNRFDEYIDRLDNHRTELAYRDYRGKHKKQN